LSGPAAAQALGAIEPAGHFSAVPAPANIRWQNRPGAVKSGPGGGPSIGSAKPSNS